MFCAIIGDIVNSRSIFDPNEKIQINDSVRHALQKKIVTTLEKINEDYSEDIILPFAIRYGDDFEGVVAPSCRYLEIAMRIIRAIYPIHVRIVFGLGSMRTIPDSRLVFQSDGPAMHCARDALTKLKKEQKNTGWFNMAFESESDSKFKNSSLLINALFTLLASITTSWSESQLKIIWTIDDYEGVKGKQKKAALKLGISNPAISESLKKSNYAAYRKAWEALTNYFIQETTSM